MSEEQPQTKGCTRCGELKPVGEFSFRRASRDGMKSTCKACDAAYKFSYYRANRVGVLEKTKQYHRANRDRVLEKKRVYRLSNLARIQEKDRLYAQANRERQRDYREANRERAKHTRLMRRYGLSLEQYRERLEGQNGQCAICGKVLEGRDIHVDHNHKTGQVRGLLCPPCNTALGLLEENPARIRRVAAYIHLFELGHPNPPAVLKNLRRKFT